MSQHSSGPGSAEQPPSAGASPVGMPGGSSSSASTERYPVDSPAGDGRSLSSVGDLVAEISNDLSTLIRQEIALAKAEVTQSATQAGKGAGMLGGAGLAGYFVLLFASITLWWAVGSLIGLGWSALVVTVLWAIVAAVLAILGRSELKKINGIPQTTATAKEIPDALKGNEDLR